MKAWRNSSLNAAPTFASGVARAGSSFGKGVAAAFIAGVSGFLYSAKVDLMRPVGSHGGRTTGKQVQADARGAAIDVAGPRMLMEVGLVTCDLS
ncbi:hypothetical protein [Mesorhizobium sp. J8]|uniref:hypothetical protein n=1 Tax=Mesorhizobium sp. J8 TaxID=2777475 RepID=UPI00191621FD|nr:hypothetical protein [Mesorhizobium sp. J8]